MDSFNDFYLLRSVVLSLSLWHTKTPHFLNSIPYCLTNGGHFTTLRRKSFYFLKKQKKKHQAFLPSALCGAPPGTRTLGPLIKRNQRATIVNFKNCVNSLFFFRFIVNLCFASAAFFAPVVPSRIRYPAVPVCKKCAKMCRAKINPLKQVSDFYAKPGNRSGSSPKQQLKSCLFRPSIKCTFTTMIHGRDLDNRTDITLI